MKMKRNEKNALSGEKFLIHTLLGDSTLQESNLLVRHSTLSTNLLGNTIVTFKKYS